MIHTQYRKIHMSHIPYYGEDTAKKKDSKPEKTVDKNV